MPLYMQTVSKNTNILHEFTNLNSPIQSNQGPLNKRGNNESHELICKNTKNKAFFII